MLEGFFPNNEVYGLGMAPPRIPVTTRIFTFLGSGIPINLYLPRLLAIVVLPKNKIIISFWWVSKLDGIHKLDCSIDRIWWDDSSHHDVKAPFSDGTYEHRSIIHVTCPPIFGFPDIFFQKCIWKSPQYYHTCSLFDPPKLGPISWSLKKCIPENWGFSWQRDDSPLSLWRNLKDS